MKKAYFESTTYKTEICDTSDYIRVKQTDKVTGITHKTILEYGEVKAIQDMLKA